MDQTTWLDYITAIGSVSTPILVIALSAIGWKIKSSVERKIQLENQLREDRVEIYNEILEPFIIILMSDAAWAQDKRNKNKDKNKLATDIMLSLEYRKLGFKLSLMGSDEVVQSYNDLMQHFYNIESERSSQKPDSMKQILILLGTFLLNIRKSMGNESTKLDHWDMCEWWMSDTRKVKTGHYNI